MTETVKTWPDLSAAAIEQRCDLSLRLWYILRQHCPDGRGWLPLETAYELSPGGKRQTRRWLRNGDGRFWDLVDDKDGQKVRLRGTDRVAVELESIAHKAPVFVPVDGNVREWRANAFQSLFAGEKFTKISQVKLSDLFGRSIRTLYVWSRLTDLEIRHNMAWDRYDAEDLERHPSGILKALGIKDGEEETGETQNCWLEHWDQYPGETGRKRWHYRRGDKPVVCWTLPNSYRSALPTGKVTTLQKRARKAVRGTLAMGRGSPTNGFMKFFYDDAKEAAKALQDPGRHEPLFYEGGAIHWGQRHMWQFQTKAKPEAHPASKQAGTLTWVKRLSPITGLAYYDVA